MFDLLRFAGVIVAAAAASLALSWYFNLNDMWGIVIMGGILINTATIAEVLDWFRWNKIKVVKYDSY